VIQIYECDTIIIRYIDENKIMKYDDIENIVRFARTNVFTYQLTAENYAEVEFINADGKIRSRDLKCLKLLLMYFLRTNLNMFTLSRDERPKRLHSHCAHNRRYMLKGKESMYICFSF
jgi:hypothetical protein